MDKIKDLGQYQTLVTETEGIHGKALLTNCYLLPEKIGQYAEAARLYYEKTAAGLNILCDMDWYYALYFFINPAVQTPPPAMDKPISLQFITIEGRQDRFFETMSAYWKSAGFGLNSRRRRLSASYDEESYARIMGAYEVIHEAKPLALEKFDEALALLLATFRPVTNLFMSRADMRQATAEGRFVCIEDAGKVIAVTDYEFERGLFRMWRIATDRGYRGHHLHWHCRRFVMQKAWEQGLRRTTAWVEDGNDISTHNVTKLELTYDGRVAEQYLFPAL